MIVAVDAMGGDGAPGSIVAGAVRAARELAGHDIVLVGDEARVRQELGRYGRVPSRVRIVHAAEVVGMHESPAVSIRKKKASSISVAVELMKGGGAQAVVSAGNTGASVAAAVLRMGLLDGVERPGIAIPVPTLHGASILIDAGANIDAKPSHLLQYALMGEAYCRFILNRPAPKVGLLNVGEEESKGTEFLKEVYRLLERAPLDFAGNIEGHDLFTGECDVIVCDGLIGNVALKTAESLTVTIGKLLKRELSANWLTRLGAILARPAFAVLRKELDYAEYGGALLLGIQGACIICHGSSSAKAIKNAIRLATDSIQQQLNQHIVETLAGSRVAERAS